jgi:hypothetical protein
MPEQAIKADEISPSPGRPADQGCAVEFSRRKAPLPPGCPFTLPGLAIGRDATLLEGLGFESSVEPNLPPGSALWEMRHGGRAAPLILAVLPDGEATLCVPSGDEPATCSGDSPLELSIQGAEKTGETGRLCRQKPHLESANLARRAPVKKPENEG